MQTYKFQELEISSGIFIHYDDQKPYIVDKNTGKKETSLKYSKNHTPYLSHETNGKTISVIFNQNMELDMVFEPNGTKNVYITSRSRITKKPDCDILLPDELDPYLFYFKNLKGNHIKINIISREGEIFNQNLHKYLKDAYKKTKHLDLICQKNILFQ